MGILFDILSLTRGRHCSRVCALWARLICNGRGFGSL